MDTIFILGNIFEYAIYIHEMNANGQSHSML